MVRQRQAHIGQKATREHIDFFLRGQFNRVAQSLIRLACVIAGNDLDFAAQQTTLCIDFFDSQLPTLFIGLSKLGNGRVTVDLSDLDRGLRKNGGRCGKAQNASGNQSVHKGVLGIALKTKTLPASHRPVACGTSNKHATPLD